MSLQPSQHHTLLDQWKLIPAVREGQLYVSPKHRLNAEILDYLKEHGQAIAEEYGETPLPTGMGEETFKDVFLAVGKPARQTLIDTEKPKSHFSPMRPGFLGGDSEDEKREEIPELPTPEAPKAPKPPAILDRTTTTRELTLPAHIRHLIWIAANGKLEKKPLHTPIGIISNVEDYVISYALNLMVGDQKNALEHLDIVAEFYFLKPEAKP